jgi:dipeptidyl aminopeptidase/acylaminoacyl peptidase
MATMANDSYLEAILQLPALSAPRVSPDGRWVAWTWSRVGPAADVYVAPTDGSQPPLQLTATAQDTYLVSWTPDSQAVIVEQDEDGNERVQLFRVDITRPLYMLPLTEARPNYYIRGGQLHPNGRWLVYGANVDIETGQEIEPTWVIRHDVQTGERKVMARPARACSMRPELNAQGTQVLYQRSDRHPAGLQLWLTDIEGNTDCEIVNVGDALKVSGCWLADGRRVLVLADYEGYHRVGLWDGGLRWLIDDPARNIEAVHIPQGSSQAVIVELRQAYTRCSLYDLERGTEVVLPHIDGNLQALAPVGEDRWAGMYFSSVQPADVVAFAPHDVRPNAFNSLTRVWERTLLTAQDFTPAEDFRWRSVDGLEIQGWLYRTPSSARASQARGTIVYVHGGPTWYSSDNINAQIQYFVRQGFNVLDPNYRGSTGFSRAYEEAIKADGWGGREQADIRAGIEALIQAGIAQPRRVGITGTSYGGYSSWYAITHWEPDVVAAAAPICGMTDLVLDYETTRPDLRPYSEEMMGGSPAQAPQRYYERSPIHFVQQIRGKLLIVQGMQDPNVSPQQVKVMEQALRQAGVPYDVLAFADEGHGIHKPRNLQVLYTRLAQFFGDAFAAQPQ